MYIFLYVFLFFLYLLLYNRRYNQSSRKNYIIIVTLVLSLVSALRHNGVGVDTYAYYITFTDSQNLSWSYILGNILSFFRGAIIKDPGYALFTKCMSTILGNFNLYLFFIAIFFLSAIGYILYKSVDNLFGYVISYSYYISLLFGFFPNSAIRQTVAMAFLLWAIIIYQNKHKKIIPIIFIVFASLIHKSVLFGLIPLFFMYIKNIQLIYKSAIILMPLFFWVSFKFVELLILLSGAEHYMKYIEGNGGTSVMFIVEMCIFYLIGFSALKYINNSSYYQRLACIAFALAISIISFIRVDPSLQRLIAYFFIWGMIFIPNALYAHKTLARKMLFMSVLALCIGRSVLIPTPYKFYWQQMELNDRYYGIYR